jgi:hypothetical protein
VEGARQRGDERRGAVVGEHGDLWMGGFRWGGAQAAGAGHVMHLAARHIEGGGSLLAARAGG